MDILLSVYILLCSNTNTPLTCNQDFKECIQIERIDETNPSVVFKKCYESDLFYRHFEVGNE